MNARTKNTWASFRFVTVGLAIFIVSGLTSIALAGEEPPCGPDEAEYVPSLDYKIGEPALNYTLTIQKNPAFRASEYGTDLFFYLRTYDEKTHDLANTFTIPHSCAGGSVPGCMLDLTGKLKDRLYVTLS